MAAPTSINQLVSSVSFAEIAPAIFAVAAMFLALYALNHGIRLILKLITGDSVQSRTQYAEQLIFMGAYVPREDFEAVLRNSPNDRSLRAYAKTASKKGWW